MSDSVGFDPLLPFRTRDGRRVKDFKTVSGWHFGTIGKRKMGWGADGFCNFGERCDDLVNVEVAKRGSRKRS